MPGYQQFLRLSIIKLSFKMLACKASTMQLRRYSYTTISTGMKSFVFLFANIRFPTQGPCKPFSKLHDFPVLRTKQSLEQQNELIFLYIENAIAQLKRSLYLLNISIWLHLCGNIWVLDSKVGRYRKTSVPIAVSMFLRMS